MTKDNADVLFWPPFVCTHIDTCTPHTQWKSPQWAGWGLPTIPALSRQGLQDEANLGYKTITAFYIYLFIKSVGVG